MVVHRHYVTVCGHVSETRALVIECLDVYVVESQEKVLTIEHNTDLIFLNKFQMHTGKFRSP